MNKKQKMNMSQMYNLIIVVALIILILLRIFGNVGEATISGFNFIGMAISFTTIIFKIECRAKRRHRPYWFFCAMGCLVVFSVIAILIFTEAIKPGTTANDVITLLALLFSVPTDLYVAFFAPK